MPASCSGSWPSGWAGRRGGCRIATNTLNHEHNRTDTGHHSGHYPALGLETGEAGRGANALPKTHKIMTQEQYFMLEWSNESGSRQLVARIYTNRGRRTTAFVPVPAGEWDGNVPKSVWAEAQGRYREDDAKAF